MFTEILSPLICVFLAHYLVPNIHKDICVSSGYSVLLFVDFIFALLYKLTHFDRNLLKRGFAKLIG